MGLFDTIELGDDVDLPEFEHGDPEEVWWQSKDIGRSKLGKYTITDDDRLLELDVEWREATEEEKDEMGLPLAKPESKEWADKDYHGSFEFHGSTDTLGNECEEKVWYSYEVRFTDGALDEIILLDKNVR